MSVRKISLACLALVVVVGLAFTGASSVSACDNYSYCSYKKVVVYVENEVPYQACVTRYDHCGTPYTDYVTLYRTVQVPVVKLVKVCY